MAAATEVLEDARRAFGDQRWGEAHRHLLAADERGLLEPDDLERLAVVHDLVGQYEASARTWERAHDSYLAAGAVARAVFCAFWAGHLLILRGEGAWGSGWMARAERLLDEHGLDGPERGLLLMWQAKLAVIRHDPSAALPFLRQAGQLGAESGDPDLQAFTWLVHGQALVDLGEATAGLRLLDEAFLEVRRGRVSPLATGIIYCAVILTCQEVFDATRAAEWTAALHDWCQQQPDLVPFRGQCLVHRSEIMQLHGRWTEAMHEVERAFQAIDRGDEDPLLGLASYQKGELHRVRGEFAEAERAYGEASRRGYDPQPGLALLRLAQGQRELAGAAIRRAVDEATGQVVSSRLLAAHVEILVAMEDIEGASVAARELTEAADGLGAPQLSAMAAQARALVASAAGDPTVAIEAAREASERWRSLGAPHEEARTRELLGVACQERGDQDTADLELAAARQAYEDLGAAPDLARLEARMTPPAAPPGGLTPRELEVLRLVATGATNQAVAAHLVISEKTVERHLSNVFTKLGIANRVAATAWAHEHGVV